MPFKYGLCDFFAIIKNYFCLFSIYYLYLLLVFYLPEVYTIIAGDILNIFYNKKELSMNFRPSFINTKEAVEKPNYEPIRNYMTRDLITFTPDQDIEHVIETMIANEISGGPVLNEREELVGIITEKDCLRVMLDISYHNQMLSKSKVSDYMTPNPVTITLEHDVLDVADAFLKTHFRRFPVIENGKLIGQVSRRDILKAAKNIERTTW
jgi:CBS domain-containing protein